jgi:hypothetical protein
MDYSDDQKDYVDIVICLLSIQSGQLEERSENVYIKNFKTKAYVLISSQDTSTAGAPFILLLLYSRGFLQALLNL